MIPLECYASIPLFFLYNFLPNFLPSSYLPTYMILLGICWKLWVVWVVVFVMVLWYGFVGGVMG